MKHWDDAISALPYAVYFAAARTDKNIEGRKNMKPDWLHYEDSTSATANWLMGTARTLPPFEPKTNTITVRREFDESAQLFDFTPKRILRSGPATIVFWSDGTKTVVKRSPDEPDNAYVAFTAALGIKLFGSNSKLKRVIDRHTEEQK